MKVNINAEELIRVAADYGFSGDPELTREMWITFHRILLDYRKHVEQEHVFMLLAATVKEVTKQNFSSDQAHRIVQRAEKREWSDFLLMRHLAKYPNAIKFFNPENVTQLPLLPHRTANRERAKLILWAEATEILDGLVKTGKIEL